MVDIRLAYEIEQFLYQEARLLDQRRFHDWINLLTDDVHYWMPIRTGRYQSSTRALKILDNSRHIESEVSTERELAIFDDTKDTLTRRVNRLDTGMAWSEEPPSRTRHLICNVQIEPQTESTWKVFSSFYVYRSRLETEQDLYVGLREDLLRKDDTGALRIAKRKIILDQNVLLAKNVSTFF